MKPLFIITKETKKLLAVEFSGLKKGETIQQIITRLGYVPERITVTTKVEGDL